MANYPRLLSIPPNLVTGEILDIFYRKTRREGQCLVWTGAIFDSTGYGSCQLSRHIARALGMERFNMNAHRLHMLLAGHVFEEPYVYALHCCPQMRKDCIELKHLYAGTEKQNAADRFRDNEGTHAFGEGHGRSVLRESDINDIRGRLFRGEYVRVIAADYGCSYGAISNIKYGNSWMHLPVRIERDRRLGNYR